MTTLDRPRPSEPAPPRTARVAAALPAHLAPSDTFARRHIGPSDAEIAEMLALLGYRTLAELADATVPPAIRLGKKLELGEPLGEHELLEELRTLAEDNQVLRSYIGMGYHDTITPPVILRNARRPRRSTRGRRDRSATTTTRAQSCWSSRPRARVRSSSRSGRCRRR